MKTHGIRIRWPTSPRTTATLVRLLVLASLLVPACARKVSREIAPGHLLWESVDVPRAALSPERVATGRRLYEMRCAACHGLERDGQGPASLFLGTPPRDFGREAFKFRTLSSSALPDDGDLFRTITVGFPAYGMPAFDYLSEESRWALVHYIKSASDRFEKWPPGKAIDLGAEPGPSAERVAQGRQAFEKAKCGMCHGEDGRGFGPSAEGLQDSLGRPIRTLDLTTPAIYYKRGPRAPDIMQTLTSGLSGTPMPSYLESGLTLEELWSLAYYVESLVGESPQRKWE
jgi:cytochrome c oxidase cbb3-type subunit 2